MLRKLSASLLLVAMACSAASSGEKPVLDMEKLLAEMQNCKVCSNILPQMDELGPFLQAEVARLNNGMAILHNMTDASKVVAFHQLSKKMQSAGAACMAMSAAEAKSNMCSTCHDFRTLIQEGANFSFGLTKSGDMIVITSDDGAIKKDIERLAQHFEAMFAMMN